MNRLRLPYFGLGPVLVAALLTLALLKGLWPHLAFGQVYRDPVVGALTLDAGDKGQDFLAVTLFVVVTLAVAAGIAGVCHTVAADGPGSDPGVAINQLLLLSLAPAGWRLAVAAVTASPFPPPPVATAAAVPLLAVAGVVLLARFRTAVTAGEVYGVVGGVILAPLIAGFAGLGVVAFVCRTFPHAAVRLQHKGHWFPEVAVGLTVAALPVLRGLSPTAEAFHRRVLRTLVVAQVGVPLAWFVAVPAALIDPQHKFAAPYPGRLVAVLAVVALASGWRVVRRWGRGDPLTLTGVLAPVTVAALAVFVNNGGLGLPSVDTDLFHGGEEILPWQQWVDFGKRPFTDFVPIHGLMNFIRGPLDSLFFDGTAANFTAATELMVAAAAALTAFAACGLVTPVGALFLAIVAMPYMDRMYMTAPALFLIAMPRLLARPVLWLVVWVATSAVAVAYNAALGPAFVLGTAPVAAWVAYRAVKAGRWPAVAGIAAAVLAVVGVGYAVVPVRRTAVGFLDFVLQNQWTNSVGNGITWASGWGFRETTGGMGSSQFLWELSRFGWVAVAVAGGAVAWRELSRPPGQRRVPLVVVGFGTVTVLLLSIPWVMGRIDAGASSRPGAMSQTALSYLVPPLVLLGAGRRRVGGGMLAVAVALGLSYPLGMTRLDPDGLEAKAEAVRVVPADAVVVDGGPLHLPRLGRIVRPENGFVEKLVRFRDVLATVLRPGETYLDFTNGQARYYYLDMPCPVRYVVYVACNAKLEAGMLAQLAADPVHAVLVRPFEPYDDVPDSLRVYDLYRTYVLKFVPVQRQEFMLLVDPARVPDAGPIGSEEQLKLLDVAFRRGDLARIPVAWGQSWPTLRPRFEPVAAVPVDRPTETNQVVADAGSYRPAGANPFVRWAVPDAVTDGAAADYLRVRFDDVPTDLRATAAAERNEPGAPGTAAEPRLALRWVNADGSYSDPVTFFARPGDLLVPLGSYPRWLLGRHPAAVRLDVVNPAAVKRFRFTELQFLRLKPIA